MRTFLISCFVFLAFNSSFAIKEHPLHIALISIEYNSNTNDFDVLFKIFIDDFDAIIARKYGVDLFSGLDNENPKYGIYATKYIKEHFGISFNKKELINDIIYNGKDLNIEAVWLKFKLNAPKQIKDVRIKASIMTDFFDDQTNLIVFKYKNFEEAFKLDNIVLENKFSID